MTKQEFLQELKDALSGNVSPEVMMDSYRYYENYIEEQIHAGKPESAVIEALGKPGLIARSIIAAKSGERVADVEYTEDGRTRKVPKWENARQEERTREKTEPKRKEFFFDMGAWYVKAFGVLFLLFLVFVVYLLLKIGFGILGLLLPLVLPVILILGIVYLLMYFFGSK